MKELISSKEHYRVSIVIPVYNVEMYLGACITSVLHQTYQNIEVILIDDGSTDCSGDICDRYAKQDARIQVIHKTNEGLGLSRNVGIYQSHGEYIMFLDADDYIDSNMVEELVNICIRNQADLCICGFYRVSDQGTILGCRRLTHEVFEKEQVKNQLLPRMIGSLPDRRDGIYSMAWGKLYSSNTIKSSKILFQSERVIKAEDIAFQIDLLPHVKKVVVTNHCYYRHRENSASITAKNRKNHLRDALFFYQYVKEKITSLGLSPDAFIRADGMLLAHLLTGLKYEIPAYSHTSLSKSYKRIKRYTQEPIVQQVLSTFPIQQASFQERVYYTLLKKKRILLLLLGLELLHGRDSVKEYLQKYKHKESKCTRLSK